MSFFHRGIARLGHLSVKFNFSYMEQGKKAPNPQKRLRDTYRGVIGLIENKFKPRVLIIGGKSMGGRIASYIAGETASVRGLLFLGYPLHPPGRTEKLRDAHLYKLDRPMLFISGTRDTLARQELLDKVVEKIGSRGMIHWVEGGGHSLKGRKKDPDGMPHTLGVIRDWSKQF